MKLRSAVGHIVRIMADDGGMIEVPPCQGRVARQVSEVSDVRSVRVGRRWVTVRTPGKDLGGTVPAPVAGMLTIVSMRTAYAHPDRRDLVYPGGIRSDEHGTFCTELRRVAR